MKHFVRKRFVSRWIAFLLCATLVFDNAGLVAWAEELQETAENGLSVMELVGSGDGEDTGNTNNGSNDGKDVVSGGDSVSGNDMVSAGDLIASGIYFGMDWTIDTNGLLTISGAYDGTFEGTSWYEYSLDVVSAKVTATGVKSTRNWFLQCFYLTSVDFSEFDTSQVTDMSHMFDACFEIEHLDLSGFDTSQVTDMSYMFSFCTSLKELNVSTFDTSKVTDFSGMFSYLDAVEELDLSHFKTSNAVNMSEMFAGSDKITSLDLSAWSTISVENMSEMFCGCFDLKSIDMSSMILVNLTDADDMFLGSFAIEEIKTPYLIRVAAELPYEMYTISGEEYTMLPMDEDVSFTLYKNIPDESVVIASGKYYGMDWSINGKGKLTISGAYDASEAGESWSAYRADIVSAVVTATGVENTRKWFYDMNELVSVDLSKFDASKVQDMSYMFAGCNNLRDLNLDGFRTTSATNMSGMFYSCASLAVLDLSSYDTGNVTNMSNLFCGCQNLIHVDLSSFDTGNVTDMGDMFAYCYGLQQLDIAHFNTDSVLNMDNMFIECTSLPALDLSKWDTSKVTDMSGMFGVCHSLRNLDITDLETDSVKDFSNMFVNCTELTSLDLSGFNTQSATDMRYMFRNCWALESLDVSNFNTSNVTDINSMFYGCSALRELDLSSFDLGNYNPTGTYTGTSSVFQNCTSLLLLKTPRNSDIELMLPVSMTDENGVSYDTIPSGLSESITLKIAVFGIAPIADQVYTGKAIKPEVVVMLGDKILVKGVDYTVSYKNNTKVAAADAVNNKGKSIAPTVIVKGKGNYTGTVQKTFAINPCSITMYMTSISEPIVYANGKKQKANPTVVVNGKKLKENKDYTIQHLDSNREGAYVEPGKYDIIIKGMGSYTGFMYSYLTILDKDQFKASGLKVESIPAQSYQGGKAIKPKPEVYCSEGVLKLGIDYSITYYNNTRPGKATLVIKGLENTKEDGIYVTGKVEKTFTIKGTAISKAKVTYNNKATYTGKAITPAVTLTIGTGNKAKTLRPYYDYTVSYINNVRAGKATIAINGCGEYTGFVKKAFTIQPKQFADSEVGVEFVGGNREVAYAASGVKPAIIVTFGDRELLAGKDYTVSYKNNKKLAKASEVGLKKAPTIVLKGKGDYKFTKNVTFDIVPKNLGDGDIVVSAADKVVSAKSLLSAPVVADAAGKKLNAKKDYTVSYTVNGVLFDGKTAEAGTVVMVTVTAKEGGNYIGTNSTVYRVTNKDINKTKIVIAKQVYEDDDCFEFTEEMIQNSAIVITDKSTGVDLVYGEHYTITGYKNNTKTGTATVTLQGIGEYGGTKNVKFSIVSKKL